MTNPDIGGEPHSAQGGSVPLGLHSASPAEPVVLHTEERTPILRRLHAVMLAASAIFLVSTFVSIAVNSLSMGLMALTWIAIMIIERRWRIVRTPLDLFFLGFVCVHAVSTVFSADPLQSLVLAKRLLLIGLVYFFASELTTTRLTQRMVAVLLGTAATVATIGVGKIVLGGPGENVRLGIFQFYMTTSELLTIAILLVFPFIIHPGTPRRLRWLAVVASLPILISLWATVTRGAYLAAATGLLFIALVRNRKFIVPLLLILAATVLFAPPYIESRIKSIIDPGHPENVSRIALWKAGIEIFKDHPVVGVGDIDLGTLIDQYADPGLPRVWGHLHNVPLQILVNFGLLGFVVVMGMLVKMFTTEWRVYRRVKERWFEGSLALGTAAAFIGFCVNGLTEWSFGDQEVITLIWTTLGMVLSLDRLTPKNDIQSPTP